MAASNYGANSTESGYVFWSGVYSDGVPSVNPTTGNPIIIMRAPGSKYRGISGHSFHVHPNGWDPMPSQTEDKERAQWWYGGQHFVGSSTMLVNYNSKNPTGTIIGKGNWWEIECP